MSAPEISVLPARRDDLAAIMALERAGFPAEEQWSERSWQGELLGERRTVLIARAHHPVGVITLQTTDRSADLHRLVVAEQHRRRGIATALIRAGLLAVSHHGARSVLLEVAYDNEAAIATYQRFGFEQLAARENYYGPGRHALILKFWDLPRWAESQLAAESGDGREELE
ncbi:GNAT family N-acetyltransferase [Microlunatus ginsengisoli]|uniref:Ribosomal protein S18-alanine N-acetyltransferase n=1 Tax=Microlunatus ginsengisoli TaxID=363863 RepID=A0ABP6ZYK5_9ACTN